MHGANANGHYKAFFCILTFALQFLLIQIISDELDTLRDEAPLVNWNTVSYSTNALHGLHL